MPDLDDFFAFQLSGGSDDRGGDSNGCGCLPWLVIGLAVVWLIGKLA